MHSNDHIMTPNQLKALDKEIEGLTEKIQETALPDSFIHIFQRALLVQRDIDVRCPWLPR